MPRPERLLIVTYRFGPEIPGGAERHLWELATRLQNQEGIECEIRTTNAGRISPVGHWGAMLEPEYPVGEEHLANGLVVRRFPIRKAPRALVAMGCKLVQRQWEREETGIDPEQFLPFGEGGEDEDALAASTSPGNLGPYLAPNEHLSEGSNPESDLPPILPGLGWHHPEPQPDGTIVRWTMPAFSLLRKARQAAGTLVLSGYAPRRTTIEMSLGSMSLGERRGLRGWFSVGWEIPPAGRRGNALAFQTNGAFCPWRDHRSLGLMISEIAFRPDGSNDSRSLSHWQDYRALLRRKWDVLLEAYLERARQRPDRYGSLFDWVRGPRCPSLWASLGDPDLVRNFDGVMAANLPWAVIPKTSETCPLPMAALALWHLDDEFYYWDHYMRALQKARVVLSNTKWASERVWPQMGVHARWAGPGADKSWADAPPRKTRDQWRLDLGLPPDAPVVLSVARKSPAKRYDLVVAAVERLRADHPNATLVLVGPDEDRRPVESPAVRYTGPMDDQDLHDAYHNADVFTMMSESESFGMVFVEAWMRGLPVVGNRWCGPVASLIDEGKDGFLASGAEDLSAFLQRLLTNPRLRKEFGAAGKTKTLRDHTWRACTSRVAAALRERVFQSGSAEKG